MRGPGIIFLGIAVAALIGAVVLGWWVADQLASVTNLTSR
jgi:hypothetical protein